MVISNVATYHKLGLNPNAKSDSSQKLIWKKLAASVNPKPRELPDPSIPNSRPIDLIILALSVLKNLFQQFMEIYLKNHFRQKEYTFDKPFKVKNPDVYCRNSYIKYYFFYRQYENYFDRTRVIDQKHILLIAVSIKNSSFYQ